VAALSPSDDTRRRRPSNPTQHAFDSTNGIAVPGRNAELDQRHQPPVGAGPPPVWVAAERAVVLLSAEQPGNHAVTPGIE